MTTYYLIGVLLLCWIGVRLVLRYRAFGREFESRWGDRLRKDEPVADEPDRANRPRR